MITLVNGKGEQINGFQFLDWDEAESYLSEQRKKGVDFRSQPNTLSG